MAARAARRTSRWRRQSGRPGDAGARRRRRGGADRRDVSAGADPATPGPATRAGRSSAVRNHRNHRRPADLRLSAHSCRGRAPPCPARRLPKPWAPRISRSPAPSPGPLSSRPARCAGAGDPSRKIKCCPKSPKSSPASRPTAIGAFMPWAGAAVPSKAVNEAVGAANSAVPRPLAGSSFRAVRLDVPRRGPKPLEDRRHAAAVLGAGEEDLGRSPVEIEADGSGHAHTAGVDFFGDGRAAVRQGRSLSGG